MSPVVGPEKAKPVSRATAAAKPLFTGKARPKYVTPSLNVFDAALERIRWLFDEFEGVQVSNSGGKDSTIVVELAAKVAAEKGKLPLRVMWLDQECEFQSTVDYQRYLAYERDDIDFRWYQIPFDIDNSTNSDDHWLHVWGEGEEWVRPKEPGSIHENTYGQPYFYELLRAIASADVPPGWCQLDGMRIEESPARRLSLTTAPMYKWVTWSAVDADPRMERDRSAHRMRFHPIYDWSYRDVWKAIHDNGWRYNAHYDHLFQHGVPTKNMRVSNFTHESALSSLSWLQEIEPATWEAATRRLAGISTYGHIGKDQMPTGLPYMFSSWSEYADYLIENLCGDEADRKAYRRQAKWLRTATDPADFTDDQIGELMVRQVIGGDTYGTHVSNFLVSYRGKKNMERMSNG